MKQIPDHGINDPDVHDHAMSAGHSPALWHTNPEIFQ